MLFFHQEHQSHLECKGAFVTDEEVEKIVDFIKSNGTANYNEDILETIENNNKADKEASHDATDDDTDELLMDAIQK